MFLVPFSLLCEWRHDIQHNDTQHDDIQYSDTQYDDIQHNNIYIVTLSITINILRHTAYWHSKLYVMYCACWVSFMLCVIMLCVIMLCVIMLCVSLCCVSLCCVPLCCVSLCCVSLCCVSLCWVSLCCVSLWWMSLGCLPCAECWRTSRIRCYANLSTPHFGNRHLVNQPFYLSD
jgi:hypothetical protein